MALMETLQDTFYSTSLNGSNWTSDIIGTGAISYTTSGMSMSIGNTSTNPTYAKLHSVGSYDLTGSYAMLDTLSVSNDLNAENELVLGNYTSPSTDTKLGMSLSNGVLDAYYSVSGVYNHVTYLTVRRYWRMRESSGYVYFETSDNGVAWTDWARITTPINVTSLKANIGIYSFGTVSGLGPFKVDGFNVIPKLPNLFFF